MSIGDGYGALLEPLADDLADGLCLTLLEGLLEPEVWGVMTPAERSTLLIRIDRAAPCTP